VDGIILAGGRSLRFGEDKAFVKLGKVTLIEYLIGLLSPVFDQLIVVANDSARLKNYPVTVIEDVFKGIGPLGGIYSGLLESKSDFSFVFACDMPLIRPSLIKYMQSVSADVVIPRVRDKVEPLHAIYSKKCLPAIEEQIKTGDYKIQNFLSGLDVRYLEEEEIRRFDPELVCFLNLNTKNDLGKVVSCLKKRKSNALF
jgi:molybdopterin-guanine dinucleotide biosynthesis protein A